MLEQVLGPAESNFTKYEYDANGNLSKILSGLNTPYDIARSASQYYYDSLNRMISNTDPQGNKETYQYDDNGNLITKTDRNGKSIKYEYDGLNRPITIQTAYNGQIEKIGYSYDKLGNPIKMTDSQGTSRYQYDDLGRLVQVMRDNGISLNYAYDILDQKTGMTLKQTSDILMDIKYEYDSIGNLIKVQEQGRTLRYRYDSTSRLAETINEITGIETKYTISQGGMLKSLVNQQAGNTISYYEYQYDRSGNQISKSDKNGTTRYYYDALSRLVTVTMPDDTIQNYSYDNLGNIVEFMEGNDDRLKLTSYFYNQNNQLLMQEETQGNDTTRYIFEYDANGNQIARDELQYINDEPISSNSTSYRFDNFNKLREIVILEGSRINYEYYGDGLRASKEIDGEITGFTYDGQNIILETDNNGMPTAKNFFGQKIISRQTAEDIYYYLFNGHGDVTQLVNEAGETIKDYEYDPFGNERNEGLPLIPGQMSISLWKNEIGDINTPFCYCGEYLDQETGYYYLRARYYDPALGRFVSKDSYEGDITNPLSLNRYSYCAGNPVVFNDPSGHEYRWIREMAAEVGATVEWNEKTRSAIVTYKSQETVYSIDYVHARNINNRIYIDDASFFSAIGAFWDNELRKAVIRQNELTVEDYADMVCGGGGVKVTGKIGSKIGIIGVGKAVKNGNLNSLPPNAKNIYKKYEASGWKGNVSGQTPGTAAGSKYLNRDGKLPTTDSLGNAITYKEFDVNNKLPGLIRDSKRFVRGSDSSVYYTNDHYRSFIEIK